MEPSKARVLIVDDEANIRIALEFLLSNAGYAIESAASGEEALEKIKTYRPQTILLDVMMPGIDGYEVAHRIRKTKELSNVSILFLTAKGEPADRMQGYATGAEFYLTKPFDNQELLDCVEELMAFSV